MIPTQTGLVTVGGSRRLLTRQSLVWLDHTPGMGGRQTSKEKRDKEQRPHFQLPTTSRT